MSVRNSFTVFLILLISACASHQPIESQKHADMNKLKFTNPSTLDSALDGFIEDNRLVGVSALIYKNNKEVYFNAFGKADRETGQPMARNTIVQIYSMTKPIVGVALMTLYEEGKFDLSDPIAKYVPELANLKLYAGSDENGEMILISPARQPTVLDFMRHTPGVGDENMPGPIGKLWKQDDPTALTNTLTEVAEKIAKIPLAYEPGSVWRYGPSVEIQALMVERLSGQSLAEYLQEKIFTPLGMKDTSYYVEPSKRDRFAQMYTLESDGSTKIGEDRFAADIKFKHWPRNPGGYGLTSTVDDYMRFALMLLNGGTLDGVRILESETIKLMATDFLGKAITDRAWLTAAKGRVGFGLDFAVRMAPPMTDDEIFGYVGEFFWDGLATTIFWVDPVNELTVVFFTQLIPHRDPIHKEFRDAVYGVRGK